MSPQRVVILLVAGLGLLGFAVWLASTRHLERATLSGDLVLPGLEHNVNTVTAVSLRKGDGTQSSLKKDGAGWTVAERAWPADAARVRKLLLDLGALTVVEEKTHLAANYPQLGVEDLSSPKAGGTRVDIVSPARTWSLIVGKASSGKSGYVRVADAEPSLLAAPLLTAEAAPRSWLDRTLIDVGVERVREVEERPASGAAYTASRVKQGEPAFTVSPLPKGRTLTGPAVAEPVAASLAGLSLDDVRKAGAGAAAGAAHATLRTYDGLEVACTGRKDGAQYLVAVSARGTTPQAEAEAQKLNARLTGFEFEIPEYRYTGIFKPLEELLTVAPGAAPKALATKSKPPAPQSAPASR
jgi:hypothetical protein